MRMQIAAVSICLAASGAMATTFNFAFPIDGLQEVPPNGSPHAGIGLASYNDVTGFLDWNIAWSGLSGAITGMHFHGPAPFGVNAGIQVNIGGISGLVSPSIGSTPINALQGVDLNSGLWYVNIHSTVFPGGEIRGQVIPAPASMSLLAIGGLIVTRRRR